MAQALAFTICLRGGHTTEDLPKPRVAGCSSCGHERCELSAEVAAGCSPPAEHQALTRVAGAEVLAPFRGVGF